MGNIAQELAKLAESNKHLQAIVKVYKNNKLVFIGTLFNAKLFMETEGGQFDIQPATEPELNSKLKHIEDSAIYVKYVIKHCIELASKGFGSVRIYTDNKSNLVDVDAKKNLCYSMELVISLLKQSGFSFDNNTDYTYFTLIWNEKFLNAPYEMSLHMYTEE